MIIVRNNAQNDAGLWTWWDRARSMRDAMDRGLTQERREPTYSPHFDVRETAGGFVFRADVPGVKQDQVDITLTGNELRISGRRDEVRADDGDRRAISEVEYGSFSRVFVLPDGVDGENVQAELKDGVLTVSVAKRPDVQPRQIKINH
jgi:HSP20 family protein